MINQLDSCLDDISPPCGSEVLGAGKSTKRHAFFPWEARRIRHSNAPIQSGSGRYSGVVNVAPVRRACGKPLRTRRSERVAETKPSAQKLLRVHRIAVDPRLVVQMWSGGAAG